ncbi:MAG: aminopeptidase [Nitrospinota bacterium]
MRRVPPSWRFFLFLLFLHGCALDTVPYVFRLAANQARLLSQRRPIEDVLKDPDSGLTPEWRQRLKLIPEVRAFARRIGLTPGDSYTQYAPVDLKIFVVTAAERTRLKRHEWWWPIVGSLPYKGYFTREGALRERRKLQGRSLDTHVRAVRAYSTLGWFDDPVVPGMLRGNLGSFVSLLLHESVHDTFFRKGHTAFNEQAAVLVERAGTVIFLREKFGRSSEELGQYQKALEGGERFLQILDGLHADLSRLYGSVLSDAEKLSRRRGYFQKFLSAHPEIGDRLHLERKSTGLSVELNNAYVLAYRLYFENRERMREVFDRIGRDLPKMVSLLKQAAEAEGDPFEALERLAKEEKV